MRFKDDSLWEGFKIHDELEHFVTFMSHRFFKWNLPGKWRNTKYDEQRKEP